ncbi:flagellar hook protein FlgE [Terasakiispira papahanaumokuakeensis]|uniref:Flagellar hook protein FlgE n=1 Tax=Terasakiispira papahanaumokuakeensis TaxID=197479 RepID=A0A1E2VB28_9GAMM|nr:flagellar hook protein FlgE [Terasakiispira papahanaumokuakeensis]ODC04181.1 flagellar hook protein FlgE [Terasakiispira papahanaumokuakeensis]
MAFNVGLSGLRGAQIDLNTIGNNVANASTTGFKQSRAEFGDVYAASVLGTGKNAVGSGVLVERVAQMHNQGNINSTDNSLDLAINGNGYFITKNNGSTEYTRNGIFLIDKDGYVVNNTGARLQGYEAEDGEVLTGALGDIRIEQANVAPRATDRIDMENNLDSGEDIIPAATAFNPDDATTYNHSTAVKTFDSLGNEHTLRVYYKKVADSTSTPAAAVGETDWEVYTSITNTQGETLFWDGAAYSDPTVNPPAANATIGYSNTGTFAGINPPAAAGDPTQSFSLDLSSVDGTSTEFGQNGDNTVAVAFTGSTQYGDNFEVSSLTQDGYTTGKMSGLNVDQDGTIYARYTNGQQKAVGQVPIANFRNPGGLKPVGSTAWAETTDSGIPTVNTAGTGVTGAVDGGSLEDSNVDLSEELVKMIVAQRNYQANAKTIQTQDALTQTIINIR